MRKYTTIAALLALFSVGCNATSPSVDGDAPGSSANLGSMSKTGKIGGLDWTLQMEDGPLVAGVSAGSIHADVSALDGTAVLSGPLYNFAISSTGGIKAEVLNDEGSDNRLGVMFNVFGAPKILKDPVANIALFEEVQISEAGQLSYSTHLSTGQLVRGAFDVSSMIDSLALGAFPRVTAASQSGDYAYSFDVVCANDGCPSAAQ